MTQTRILHIVPWFPNPENEIEAIFIAKHLKSIKNHHNNRILHLKFGAKKEKLYDLSYEGIPLDRVELKPFVDKWRVKELMAEAYLKKYLRKRQEDFDIVNFYIAYPNAIGIAKLQEKFPNIIFTISEQWSAYHEEFKLPKDSKGRRRIEEIFHTKVPLFVVSSALGEDIRNFTGMNELDYSVIPNIVDASFIHKKKEDKPIFTFCSINNWSTLKNPIVLIEAFHLISQKKPNVRLILGGTGVLSVEMKNRVEQLGLIEKVSIKGRLNNEEVKHVLQQSNVYCQSSNYETFSAICIEALATGTPVIATNIGGMKDFINENNGLLVNDMTPEAWSKAMLKSIEIYSLFESKTISCTTIETYNANKIGAKYANYFTQLVEEI